MSLASALQSFLVEPPANLLLALGGGLLLMGAGGRRSRRWRMGRWLAGMAFLGLVALAMPVVSRGLQVALERDLPLVPPPDHPPGAIVVLSADELYALPGGIVATPNLGTLTLERLRAGALLHHRTGLPLLVTGGASEPGGTPIAASMARVLESEFAAPARWVEGRSGTTWENALFSAELLRPDGIGSVYVVTHAWHMRRALLAFRRAGLHATAAPTHFTGPPFPEAAALVPNAQHWGRSGHALHEWIGLAWYALRH